ncbi:hypothetical protein DFH27DRAFT_641343 [Peziza echinospora]|nr:hypothetical protein DFH27DRAFT_641343 [Peziza echinospora]
MKSAPQLEGPPPPPPPPPPPHLVRNTAPWAHRWQCPQGSCGRRWRWPRERRKVGRLGRSERTKEQAREGVQKDRYIVVVADGGEEDDNDEEGAEGDQEEQDEDKDGEEYEDEDEDEDEDDDEVGRVQHYRYRGSQSRWWTLEPGRCTVVQFPILLICVSGNREARIA